ncbi:MAG TPA: hypothetical protein VFK24_04805 [Gammaproteobacteria bacterium]|nr:hypothetical protein [Gammaproteobacteria bacterium]
MALTVADVQTLREYIIGVMERADHHGQGVNEIALALVGAILWRKDENEPIQVRTHGGETKNVLWVHMGGQRYAFRYEHNSGEIEMRQENIRGPLVHAFSNQTSLSDLKQAFEAL